MDTLLPIYNHDFYYRQLGALGWFSNTSTCVCYRRITRLCQNSIWTVTVGLYKKSKRNIIFIPLHAKLR